ncbi:DUF6907 domain-containing protein [Litorihabitans aurantiacus]|uniref:Uncharacterized protein n=1 Tax=Litorihabitans aurantiacus TaxID=1930061 RepID=A0AA37XHZ2_9MICO|nr:hypothetical protein [Litorihabitans aurantiacus]GMA33530.1 hypothetical protein GCM10025875_35220 [Litorihabitans aurantiacus]GMA33618.1 hypothetical protein GCM10025875_36100 [Litorihabitans aurantiacus]
MSKIAPVACQPWCRDGQGHTGEAHVDDQWCMSPDVWINLAPANTFEGYPSELLSGRERLAVTATRRTHVYRGRPVVQIWAEDRDIELWLSAEDARALADELVAAARLIEEARR